MQEFLCLQYASIHWQEWWSKGEEAGPSSCKDMVCHMYGTGRDVTIDFFTSCELANFLLSKNMTVFETLRKNTPEIPALFLSGKQRTAYSSIFGFTYYLTLVSYIPARNKTVILFSSQHHDDT